MGKIMFNDLHNMDKANEFFNRAYANWKDKDHREYKHLLHGLAFTYYQKAKGDEPNSGPLPKREKFKKSLTYWNTLKDLVGDTYLVNYAMGNTYLRLNELSLAEAEFKHSLEKLKGFYEVYKFNSGNVTKDVRNKVEVMSDVYNNLAVTQMAKAYGNLKPIHNKKDALVNVMNAIDLKDRMRIEKGIAQANFNRMNDPRIDSVTHFKISDKYIPRTIH